MKQDHQFKIDGNHFSPFRRNRNKFGEWKNVYVKDGLIVKRLNGFETNISDNISLELTISNQKWFIMFVYRPPVESNKLTFSITNIVNSKICFKTLNGTLLDIMLTYKPKSFLNPKLVPLKQGSAIDIF